MLVISLYGEPTEYSMKDVLAITKALADESRIRVLGALREGELCVCQITELLGLAPSTVSKHLLILLHAGLLECRKDGRWMYYKLSKQNELVKSSLRWILSTIEYRERIAKDGQKLKTILRTSPEALCRRQRTDQQESR